MEFNKLLNDLLAIHNKTRMDLSKEAGIPYTTICGWMNAGRLPDYDTITKLAQYFHVSTDYILGVETESAMPPDEQILINAYRALSPGKKQALFQMLDLDETAIKRNKKA